MPLPRALCTSALAVNKINVVKVFLQKVLSSLNCQWGQLTAVEQRRMNSTAQAHRSSDKLVTLAVSSAPAAPSRTSPPAGTRSTSASALSPPGRSMAEDWRLITVLFDLFFAFLQVFPDLWDEFAYLKQNFRGQASDFRSFGDFSTSGRPVRCGWGWVKGLINHPGRWCVGVRGRPVHEAWQTAASRSSASDESPRRGTPQSTRSRRQSLSVSTNTQRHGIMIITIILLLYIRG